MLVARAKRQDGHVKDAIDTVQVRAKRVEIAHVALNDLHPAGLQRVAKVHLADDLVEYDNSLRAGLHKRIDDVRADEARPARDEEGFAVDVHLEEKPSGKWHPATSGEPTKGRGYPATHVRHRRFGWCRARLPTARVDGRGNGQTWSRRPWNLDGHGGRACGDTARDHRPAQAIEPAPTSRAAPPRVQR